MSATKADSARPADHFPGQASKPTNAREFAPGMRLSGLDIGVLLATGAGCGWIAVESSPLVAGGIAFVVGHFFLFCNVFRFRRAPELIWAAVFTGLAAATILLQTPGWMATFAISALLTVVLVAIEMRHPSYHGLFWRQVNPRLPDYWQSKRPDQ